MTSALPISEVGRGGAEAGGKAAHLLAVTQPGPSRQLVSQRRALPGPGVWHRVWRTAAAGEGCLEDGAITSPKELRGLHVPTAVPGAGGLCQPGTSTPGGQPGPVPSAPTWSVLHTQLVDERELCFQASRSGLIGVSSRQQGLRRKAGCKGRGRRAGTGSGPMRSAGLPHPPSDPASWASRGLGREAAVNSVQGLHGTMQGESTSQGRAWSAQLGAPARFWTKQRTPGDGVIVSCGCFYGYQVKGGRAGGVWRSVVLLVYFYFFFPFLND